MSETEAPIFDLAIVGGGLVGCSLAVALGRQGKKTILIEAQPESSMDSSWDERCIGLNAGSKHILQSLDLWNGLAPSCEPILSTHISERGRFGAARFSAEQAGLQALGYNTPLRTINELLWARAVASNITIRRPAKIKGMDLLANSVKLQIEGADPSSIHAKLVVAADGAHSAVRRILGYAAATRDYGQSAIVTAVRPQYPHQGIAYERFLKSGPMAVLPKPDDEHGHACSLVWTLGTDEAKARLLLSDNHFLSQAQDAFGERLGRFLDLGRRQSYPLHQVINEQIVGPRTVFIGNAAQSLHPVAAQGFNLGLRDAATLASVLTDVSDPGDAELLSRYLSRREQDRQAVADFTDKLVRLFSNAVPGLRTLRHLGLLFLEFDSPVRQHILRQNLGTRNSSDFVMRT